MWLAQLGTRFCRPLRAYLNPTVSKRNDILEEYRLRRPSGGQNNSLDRRCGVNFCFPASALFLIGWFFSLSLSASEWTRFRGPNGSGVSEGAALPSEFGPAKNLVWRTSLPLGHSSPAFGAGSIFLTGFEGDKLLTIALDRRSGEMQWQREILRKRQGQLHEDNTPASPSPATDGENVYVFFQDVGLVSYGPEGGERWRIPLGPFNNLMGLGASPILADGKVIQVCDSESDAFMLAVHKDTGEVAWRDERSFVRRGFSTPLLYDPPEGGGLQVLVTGSYQLIAYSVASGKKMWWTRGLTWQQKPTPVKDRDTIYVQNWAGGADFGNQKQVPSFDVALKEHDKNQDGKLSREEAPDPAMTGNWPHFDLDQDGYLGARDWEQYRNRSASVNSVMAIRLGGEGDMSDSAIKWQYHKSLPNVPSPLLYKGVLYMMKEGGIVTSLDPETGKVLKQARLPGALGRYFASPVAADNKIFMVSEEGKISVLKPGADWEVLATNDLGESCYATPAVVDGRIYVRTTKALYCFSKQSE